MTNQNIYNDPLFFEGYSRLRWSETGLNKVMEEPAIRSLMPDLTGKRVLDMGCGFGHVARYVRKMGAAEVLGIDISDRMIEAARQATDDPAILYAVKAMQDLEPTPNRFDVVVSSMALQYIDDYETVVRTVARIAGHRRQLPVFHRTSDLHLAPARLGAGRRRQAASLAGGPLS